MKWKCKDGREVEPREMSDSHLLNAHAFVVRREKVRLLFVLEFLKGLPNEQDMSDGVADAIGMEIEEMRQPSPFLRLFSEEIEKRDLRPLEVVR